MYKKCRNGLYVGTNTENKNGVDISCFCAGTTENKMAQGNTGYNTGAGGLGSDTGYSTGGAGLGAGTGAGVGAGMGAHHGHHAHQGHHTGAGVLPLIVTVIHQLLSQVYS